MTDTRYRSIALRRSLLKLTQEELAERAHIARQTLGLIEGGKTTPSLENALAIASVLGCDVPDLFLPLRWGQAIQACLEQAGVDPFGIDLGSGALRGEVPVLIAGRQGSGRTTLLSSLVRSVSVEKRVLALFGERDDHEVVSRDGYLPPDATVWRVPTLPDGPREPHELHLWTKDIEELAKNIQGAGFDVIVIPELREEGDFVAASILGARTKLPIFATVGGTTRDEVDGRILEHHSRTDLPETLRAIHAETIRAFRASYPFLGILLWAESYWNSAFVVYADRKKFRIESLFDPAHPTRRTITTVYEAWCEDVARRVTAAVPELEYVWAARLWPGEERETRDRDVDFGNFSKDGRFVNVSLMHDGRLHISGLEAVLTPVPPGGRIPRAKALIPGSLAQLLSMNHEGAEIAAAAIIGWLTFDDAKTDETREAMRRHQAIPLLKD